MKILGYILLAAIGVAVALAVWMRLSPIDTARWHIDITAPDYTPPGNAAAFCRPATSRVSFGAGDLAGLDAIATAAPRTTRMAGSVAEGHITWVTRTRLMGFPDFTTAQIKGDRLCVIARQGVGLDDLSVNSKRLGAWLQQLGGLNERPDLRWE